MTPSEARRRLVARAREELPIPGEPARLLEDLRGTEWMAPEACEVLSRALLAWRQLRDLRLERAWQRGFGWFLARNVILFAFFALLGTLFAHVPQDVLHGALAGVGIFYLLVLGLGPLRLARHRRRREAILRNYGQDLGAYLDSLEQAADGPSDPGG